MAPSDSVTRTLHRAGLAPPLPVRVRVVGTGQPSARLERGTLTVGGASTCDLVVDDPGVSRRHVELELVPEGVHVRDLKSRNGTYFLGQRVERMVLAPGASLRIGSTTLAIELDTTLDDEPLTVAGFRGMIGTSKAMQQLFGTIARLDGSLLPLLVTGETGVGKELVARALHEGSRVSSGPFVPINCGAIPRELVASTLFGHKKGAFTGATEARRGAFGAASGGTLLLDEIGELPLDVQPALLRVLERGEVVAVGEDVPRKVEVRLVAATHRDLLAEVRAGRFREDLYYRLSVVKLVVPPLRDRREDIAELATFFARQEGQSGLPADVLEELAARPFPGNVRELRNVVLAYVALGVAPAAEGAGASTVGGGLDQALSAAVRLDLPFLAQREAIAERFSAHYVDRLLAETKGNQTLAAKLAGLDRTYLGRLLAKLGKR
ncbi:MAG: sigma 54-dependent Fis family transcriptional regulator [Myxococcales bacterium]|nr:sigma 54-dependent Fis family transcriptional regulator [Myxococcales bacterium]